MKYLLSYDIGTSGVKTSLFSIDSRFIDSTTYKYKVYWSHDGHAEQNPQDWYHAICTSTKKVIASVNKNNIAGISFSGQMQGCICVDAKGTVLHNAIIWADTRAKEQEQYIREHIDEQEFYYSTGNKISASYTLEKLMWLKKYMPDVYNNTHKVLNAKDYIIFKLTGNFITDYSDASATNVFDIHTLTWSQHIADIAAIDLEKMPAIAKSTDVVGYISTHASRDTGLPHDTPVVCGGGDGPMAAVGALCIKPNTAFCTIGTSAWNAITRSSPIFDHKMRTFNLCHVVPEHYMPLGTMQAAGASINWLTQLLASATNRSNNANDDIYKNIGNLVRNCPIGSHGVIFLPYLMGERSPWWNQDIRGSFIGLSISTTQSELFRAVYEGIAMNLEMILRVFMDSEFLSHIVLTGGVARNKTLYHILADIYEIPIHIPNYIEEATSIGATITAGVGIGIFKDFHIIEQFISIVDTVIPNSEYSKTYTTLKNIFQDSYYHLQDTFKALSRFRTDSLK